MNTFSARTGHAHIDYLTFHLWPYNWRWFDPLRPEETLPVTRDRSRTYVGRHVALARQLGKPLVLEEFGLTRDGGAVDAGSPDDRTGWFLRVPLRTCYCDFARSDSPLAGSNFWTWGGEERTQVPTAMLPGNRRIRCPAILLMNPRVSMRCTTRTCRRWQSFARMPRS